MLRCQPAGLENFFDAFVKGMMDKVSPAQMEPSRATAGGGQAASHNQRHRELLVHDKEFRDGILPHRCPGLA
jgi:hypothetical protein